MCTAQAWSRRKSAMEMLSAGPHRFSNASRWREDLRVKPHAAVDVVVSRKRLGASPRTQTYFSRADSSRPSPRRSTGTTGPNSSAGPPDPGRGGLSEGLELATLGCGALVQPRTSPQLPRRRPAGRVRVRVLRCPCRPRTAGRNQMARVSIRPRAFQSAPTSPPDPLLPCALPRPVGVGLARYRLTGRDTPTA